MKFGTLPRALTGALMLVSTASQALPIQYAGNRAGFEATLVSAITDDYSNPGYAVGDVQSVPGAFNIFSDSAMSAVLGETDYRATTFPNLNAIQRPATNPDYCAGCNGSFELSFTSTSVGDATGVFGVGFDITDLLALPTLIAFVTFGDNTTLNIDFSSFQRGFWGITAAERIRSIHFGLADGVADGGRGMSLSIDNLTIGRQAERPVPEPAGLGLLGLGLVAAGLQRRRRMG